MVKNYPNICMSYHEYILIPWNELLLNDYITSRSVCCQCNGPLTRYLKFLVAHAPGTFLHHRLQRKPSNPILPVTDPDMHHSTWVTHVPWCMSESLTPGGGEDVPGIPDACATHNFRYLAGGSCVDYYSWYVCREFVSVAVSSIRNL